MRAIDVTNSYKLQLEKYASPRGTRAHN
jgi:hypothetical protein